MGFCWCLGHVAHRDLIIDVWPGSETPFFLPVGDFRSRHPQYGIRLNHSQWVTLRSWELRDAFAHYLEEKLSDAKVQEAWNNDDGKEFVIAKDGGNYSQVHSSLARLTGIDHDDIKYLYEGLSPAPLNDEKICDEIAMFARVTISYQTTRKVYYKFNSVAKHHTFKIRFHLNEADDR